MCFAFRCRRSLKMRAHAARECAQTKNVLKKKKKKKKKKEEKEETNRTLLLRLRCLSRPQSKNVVLRGLEESHKEEGSDRKAEDVERVVCLFQEMGIHANDSIKAARRLGTRDPEKRYRPLLLRVSEELREKLLHCKEKLRQLNTRQDTRYRFDPDLTPAQLKRYNEMWKEAEERNKK